MTEPGLTSKLELCLSDNCGSVAPGLKNWMDDSPPHSEKNSWRTNIAQVFNKLAIFTYKFCGGGGGGIVSLNILGNLLV